MDPAPARIDDAGSGTEEGAASVPITRVTSLDARSMSDVVAVEEPLEIRLEWGEEGARQTRAVSITMRTPGQDRELAAGFLFGEGILRDPADVKGIHHCGEPPPGRVTANTIRVEIQPSVSLDHEALRRSDRSFFSSSSCGVCGKASLDALSVTDDPGFDPQHPRVSRSMIHRLPERLLNSQRLFERTGGLHASGLFRADGELIESGEDVGRHNAVDKVVGSRFLAGETSHRDGILTVSGRTSYEILQKALKAQIPIVVAVGAPSSLARELALRFGMTLIGFTRNEGYNVYSGAGRIGGPAP